MGPDQPLLNAAAAPTSTSSSTPQASEGDNAPARQPQANTDATASAWQASPSHRPVLTPWYFTRVCAVYIGSVEYVPGKISHRWLIVSENVFYVMTAGQIVLTAVLTVLGGVNKDRVDGTKSELEACPELVVASLLWLVRPMFIGYFLLWAHMLKRTVLRLRKARLAATPMPLAPNADRAQAERAEVPAGHGLSDEDVKKLLPTHQNVLFHLRLIAFTPVLTWILNVIMMVPWLARMDHCRSASPHIFALASIIMLAVNLSLTVHFGFMFGTDVKNLMRSIRSRLPSVAPLSQSAVDRIPLVIYRAPVSPIPSHPKDTSRPGFFQAFRIPTSPSRLPDIEDGMETTPLLDQADMDDVEDPTERAPLIDLADGPSAATQHSPYPYVTLPDDEAKCTICFCDFTDSSGLAAPTGPDVALIDLEDSDQSDVELVGHRAADSVRSEPPSLLRRLSCGHVYHKECIDPWLTQKSGRCPYCQKAVEVPVKEKWSFWKFLKCQCQCRRSR